MSVRSYRGSLLSAIVVAGLAGLLVLPLPVSGQTVAPQNVPGRTLLPTEGVPVNFSVGSVPSTLSPIFWGTTVSPRTTLYPSMSALINSTPTEIVVWPGGTAGDTYDPINNTEVHLADHTLIWTKSRTSEEQFVTWCESIRCQAILQVPGEIDNISIATQIVEYTVNTLHFQPAYWEIGNEPGLWRQWGRPWNEWNSPPQNGTTLITPGEYAWEARNYTLALRAIDPSFRLLGLAGTGRPEHHIPLEGWINASVAVDGSLLSGIAFHVYPGGKGGNTTLQGFYGDLQAPYGLAGRVIEAESAISNELNLTCPSCAPIPVFVTELGSALSHRHFGPMSSSFAGALAMAASEVQGANLGAANIDVFASVLNTSNSWFNAQGVERPDYAMYAQMLSHMGNEVYPVDLQTPSGPAYNGGNDSLSQNLFALATVDPAQASRNDLFLENLNVTTSVSLSPVFPAAGTSLPAMVWEWSGVVQSSPANNTTWVTAATPEPLPSYFPEGLPSTWTLPPQTAVLFETYPQGAFPVTFHEAGLPTGARWFVSVGGREMETSQQNMTEFLPTGNYTLLVPTLALPIHTGAGIDRTTYIPSAPSNLEVGRTGMTLTISYHLPGTAFWVAPPPPPGIWDLVGLASWVGGGVVLGVACVLAVGRAADRWARRRARRASVRPPNRDPRLA